ncbi:unnamed protein product [Effrenium voratum]|nr:unnamed protein product [Effrenium voratum]
MYGAVIPVNLQVGVHDPDAGGNVLTFAYGANMGLAKLLHLGIHPKHTLVGMLPHHELIFDKSLTDGEAEPAFANIRHTEDPGDPLAVSPVHGVVHDVKRSDLAKLDASEAPLYHRVKMPVEVDTPAGAREVMAWTYVGNDEDLGPHVQVHGKARDWVEPGTYPWDEQKKEFTPAELQASVSHTPAMSRLRVILRDRAVLVTLGANLELLDLQLGSDEAAAELDAVPGFAVSQAGRELTRALERHALAHDAADSLQKLLIRWRKTRRSDPILEAVGASRPGPRVFVDRVGRRNLADLSWEVLAPDVAGGFFEVALFGYAPRAAVSASASPRLRQLGSFRVPGNSAARGHRLTRLQPQRWYRVQVRSVGPRKRWVSQWSAEVPFRTLSTSAAKESKGCT